MVGITENSIFIYVEHWENKGDAVDVVHTGCLFAEA